jgi:hypothetical protein
VAADGRGDVSVGGNGNNRAVEVAVVTIPGGADARLLPRAIS